MDSTSVRIILLILGVAFIAGIYLWDKKKHVDARLFKKQARRKPRQHDTGVFDAVDTPPAETSTDQLEPLDTNNETEAVASEDLSFSAAHDKVEINNDVDDLSFSSRSAFEEFEAGADLPTKIIQINLIARSNEISGQMIMDLASELNLQLGEFNIFHRMDEKSGKSVFSMANAIEPGYFDADNMLNFKTPGLTIFTQLPAPIDCLTAYSEMVNVAKRIGYIVGAEIQDSSHSVMTEQSIDHEREAIIEYRQKLQMALQATS